MTDDLPVSLTDVLARLAPFVTRPVMVTSFGQHGPGVVIRQDLHRIDTVDPDSNNPTVRLLFSAASRGTVMAFGLQQVADLWVLGEDRTILTFNLKDAHLVELRDESPDGIAGRWEARAMEAIRDRLAPGGAGRLRLVLALIESVRDNATDPAVMERLDGLVMLLREHLDDEPFDPTDRDFEW